MEPWPGSTPRWGIYEKALPAGSPWSENLAVAARAGYQFIELSIDECDERLARLEWTCGQRREMRHVLADAPASIDTVCLSAHRRYALGSQSEQVRGRALDIMRKTIDLAAEIGIRMIQIAGYDVHYEESTERTRSTYAEGIQKAVEWARGSCVMLALENVDCPFIDSIEKAMRFVRSVDSPWFQLYPDIGNLTAVGKDVQSELRAGGRHIVGVHVKDTRAQEFRRVPLGEGCVNFEAAFRTLKELDFRGPLTVEMWNDAAADPAAVIAEARRWLGAKLDSVAAG